MASLEFVDPSRAGSLPDDSNRELVVVLERERRRQRPVP
jgi:hypothetical protein